MSCYADNLPTVVSWKRKGGSLTSDLQSRTSNALTTTPSGHMQLHGSHDLHLHLHLQLHVRWHDASVELVAPTITSCNYRVTLTIVTDIWCVRHTAAVCMWKQCLLDACNLFTLYSSLTECLFISLNNNNLIKYSTPRWALSEHEHLSFSDQMPFKLDCCNALQPS